MSAGLACSMDQKYRGYGCLCKMHKRHSTIEFRYDVRLRQASPLPYSDISVQLLSAIWLRCLSSDSSQFLLSAPPVWWAASLPDKTTLYFPTTRSSMDTAFSQSLILKQARGLVFRCQRTRGHRLTLWDFECSVKKYW